MAHFTLQARECATNFEANHGVMMALKREAEAPTDVGLSPEQVENLRTVARGLGQDRGWLLWGPLLDREGKPKRPCWIDAAGRVQERGWNKPENTHSFEEAIGWVGRIPKGADGRRVEGVGFLIGCATDPRIVVLDFDGVMADGQPCNETGREALRRFAGTYGEETGSETGTRVPLRAGPQGHGWQGGTGKIDLPGGGSVELYAPDNSKGKFFRLTGNRIETCARDVTEQAAGLKWVVDLMNGAQVAGGCASNHPAKPAANKTLTKPADATAEELLEALQALAPFGSRKGWSSEAKDSDKVLRAFETIAGKAAKSGKDHDIARVMRGEIGGRDGDSEVDTFVCCEAIRRGARTYDDVAEVWAGTPAWRDNKPGSREDYVRSTITDAAARVLDEAQAKADPRRETINQLKDAAQAAGDSLKLTAEGTRATASLGNLVAILRHDEAYRGCARFNEFTEELERARSWRMFDKGAADEAGKLRDDDLSRLRIGIERKYGIAVEARMAREAAEVAARDHAYHPIRQRLLELHQAWDGAPRLDKFLQTHARAVVDWAGHDLTPYLEVVGPLMMVGIVARVFKPGCKLDSQITLVGPDGARKSSFWKVLADSLGPGLFTDAVPDLDGDQIKLWEATKGKLIVEVAEGAAVRKSDLQKTKAALSTTGGTFRTAWGALPEDRPRKFVLVSTANDLEFLPNGDAALRRRFWPVIVGADKLNPIDTDALAEAVPQLWGEAVALYLEMSDDGQREPAIYIDPHRRGEAFARWQLLLGEVSDEAGPYGDILQDLNRVWHGLEPIRADGVQRVWPELGCTTREIATLIGYGGDKFSSGEARTVAAWAKAAGLVARKGSGSARWRPSAMAPREFDD